MRTEAQIRHKLKQVAYRHLQKRMRKQLACQPGNCAFFREVQGVGVCVATWKPPEPSRVCQDPRPQSCEKFEHRLPKEKIKEVFWKFVKEATVEELHQAGMHDLATLLWVLDEEFLDESDVQEEPEATSCAPLSDGASPPVGEATAFFAAPSETEQKFEMVPEPDDFSDTVELPKAPWYKRWFGCE